MGRLTISVENKSLKSRVNGRSSSVMRRSLDDVWCILLCGDGRNVEDEFLRRLGDGLRSKSLLRSFDSVSPDRLRSTEARSSVICGVGSSFGPRCSSESSGEGELAEL